MRDVLIAFVAGAVGGWTTGWLIKRLTGRTGFQWLSDYFRRDRLRLPR